MRNGTSCREGIKEDKIERRRGGEKIYNKNTCREHGAPFQFLLCSRLYTERPRGRPLFYRFIEPLSRLKASNNTNFTLPYGISRMRSFLSRSRLNVNN